MFIPLFFKLNFIRITALYFSSIYPIKTQYSYIIILNKGYLMTLFISFHWDDPYQDAYILCVSISCDITLLINIFLNSFKYLYN